MTIPAILPEALQATRRGHIADQIFDQLAAAILQGELPEGMALPAERVLADRFGTSRIIVRQAVHRLDEIGLVRVKQGGATIVLDPDDAGDLRVLELFYRLAPKASPAALDPRDVLEKQFLQGLSLIDVAQRRAAPSALAQIRTMVEAFADGDVDEEAYAAFEERFWRAVAHAGGNRIFVMEVAWWYRVLTVRPSARRFAPSPLAARVAFYRELARRLEGEGDAAQYYRKAVQPTLDAIVKPAGGKRRGPTPPSPGRKAPYSKRRNHP